MRPASQRERPSAFLRFGRTTGAGLRLYCFAHAGGTAATYAPWARLLTPEAEVLAVELPGHGTRMGEEPETDVNVLARQIASQIAEQQDDGLRFAFYGHSLGAAIAFETALALRDPTLRNQAPSTSPATLEHLFVGAARAPHLPPTFPPLSHLDDQAFLTGVQQRYGGISDEVLAEPELLEMILPPLRADFAAYESYSPVGDRLLTCPVTAFAGTLDPVVRLEAVAAWADHTSGSFRFHPVPGDHFFLAAHRELVLGLLQRALKLTASKSGMASEAAAGTATAVAGSVTGALP